MAKLISYAWPLCFVVAACANGNCRQIQSSKQFQSQNQNQDERQGPEQNLGQGALGAGASAQAGASGPSAGSKQVAKSKANVVGDATRVLVYKDDGSLQCAQGQAKTPAEMAKELKGIKIFSSLKKSDGLMHIQVCGSKTGQVNVFEILESDLPRAEKKAFKLWNLD